MMLQKCISGLVTKCSVVQTISSGQTFTNILHLRCDLDLECSNPSFHRTLWLMMLYYQTVFGCKPTSSLEDTTEIVKFWLIYKPSLWPWHWRQWTHLSAWHSGSWCCMTLPSLVTECSVVQKISEQTITNILDLHCNPDLKCSNPFFHRTLRLMML